jgi:mono/diheme cytochrome c family protein
MTKAVTRGLAAFLVLLLVFSRAGGQEGDSDGAALFARYCASCHGRVGEGDGPVASAMAVSIPNLRTLSARSNGNFPRDAVMQYIDGRNPPAAHGDRLMPVWGDTFAQSSGNAESGNAVARRRIAAITDFVEQLQN